VRQDSIARGAGTADMKGGNAVLLYALKALAAAGGGVLDRMDVTVVITGDEESVGRPVLASREAMIAAAKRSDLALSFEGGGLNNATIGRRGASGWILKTTGRQAHSSGVFGTGAGYGAVYELARILNGFREALAGRPGLTFNPGLIGGGEAVAIDTSGFEYTVTGKTNIIAPGAIARGDLRFATEGQKDSARATMREIVARHLPGTGAEIEFDDSYPAMPVTPAGRALLARYDSVSRALGYPPVGALNPLRRGAGDIAFVAAYIPGLDGLGPFGGGAHSPEEWVNLPSLRIQTERAAVLLYRLAVTGYR
jgi:glutamate carboxypeptidase